MSANGKTRALIIAIEDYREATEMARELTGTTNRAEDFAKWIEGELEVPREQITFCSSRPNNYSKDGSERKQIKKAIERLVEAGANSTERLFVYISGHGAFSPGSNNSPHSNLLLTSDFVSSRDGDACICLEELTNYLSRGLGRGSHIHLLDMCRTPNLVLPFIPLGMGEESETRGVANWFQIFSATPGNAAINDSLFSTVLLEILNGTSPSQVLERDGKKEGLYWLTFNGLFFSMEQEFSKRKNRSLQSRNDRSRVPGIQEISSDVRIRSLTKKGPTATIVDEAGCKAAPISLLIDYDDIVFLGETNWQVPDFLEKALQLREHRPWNRLDVLSVKDLSQSGRPGVSQTELEKQREQAENRLTENASKYAHQLYVYRYDYQSAETYGSFWKASDGRRRVHVSQRIDGFDNLLAPSHDFIDFPESRLPYVDTRFELVKRVLEDHKTEKVFPV